MSVDPVIPPATPPDSAAPPTLTAVRSAPALDPALGAPTFAPAATDATAAAASAMATATAPAAAVAPPAWSLLHRIGFRFAFIYLILYSFPFPLDYLPIPGLDAAFTAYNTAWDALVAWTGRNVLHLSHPVQSLRGQTGSGDTTYDYVQLLCYAALALLAAILWTLADRRSSDHRRLNEWLRIYVRYLLGATVLGYGMAKVIKTQFPFPSADRLLEPFGEASPMGLLWTFMGYSTPYTIFAGAMEVLGGLLLFFRRTTTLGALVIVAVMTNVVMLNLSYDVPVKQYSMHLLLMAALLLVPDLRRLANVLVLNRPAAPADLAPPFAARWARVSALALSVVFLGYLLYTDTTTNLATLRQFGPAATHPPLYGSFEVEEVVRNGQPVPPLLTTANRWRRLSSTYKQFLSIRWMDGSLHRYRAEYPPSPTARSVTLYSFTDKSKQGSFTYAALDKDHMILRGNLLADALVVKLRRIDLGDQLLVKRGFHWITEFPFNR